MVCNCYPLGMGDIDEVMEEGGGFWWRFEGEGCSRVGRLRLSWEELYCDRREFRN